MQLSEKKLKSSTMFDSIATRYDFTNRVLSFGLDTYWRKKTAHACMQAKPSSLLDLATGTGDQILAVKKLPFCPAQIVGVDPSAEMLKIAQKKVDFATFLQGSATTLPFNDQVFDACMISFGIRNFAELQNSLQEIYRVLKPSGELIILEFSTPENKLLQKLYYFHLKHIMPKIASLCTGKQAAYEYLDETIRNFPSGKAFASLLEQAGFASVKITPLTFGAVSIYKAKKAP